jgi:ABC-type transporter Mla subunit MlaD
MEFVTLPILLDGIIALLLLATIAYVIRLTLYLKAFKDSRSELQTVVKTLSAHIDKADKAIHSLNQTVDDTAEDLKYRMDKANAMFDELDLVVQTGDALANRLEELAIRNRKIMDGGEGDLGDLLKQTQNEDYDRRVKKVLNETEKAPSNFAIRDPEMEKGGKRQKIDGFTTDDDEVLSEAERDLYEALQKNKKRAK